MFEFYYQTGEFAGDAGGLLDFLKNLIVQIAGTAIGAWAAISLYKTQKNDQKIKEDEHIQAQESAKLRYLAYLILKSEKFNNDLILQLEDCIDRIVKNPLMIGGLSIFPENNLLRVVDKLNHEEYYLSYVNRFKGKDHEISALFDALDAENKVKDLIYETWSESFKNNNQKGLAIQKAVSELTHELRYLQNNDLLPEEQVKDIVKIMKDHAEKSRKQAGSYRIIADELFLPIADYLDEKKNEKYRAAITKMYNISSEHYLLIDRLAFDNNNLKTELEYHLNVLKQIGTILDMNTISLKNEFPMIRPEKIVTELEK